MRESRINMRERNYFLNYFIVVLIFAGLLIFLYTLNITRGSITGNIIKMNTRPLLVISDVKVENIIENSKCNTYIKGKVINKGGIEALDAIVKCIKPVYPETDINQKFTKIIGNIDKDETIFFEISFESDCKEIPKFDCIPSCKNC